MKQDIKTLELAKVYESQEYYQDAYEIYAFLDSQESTPEIRAGLKRMKKRVEEINTDSAPEGPGKEERVAGLFEEWLMLLVLRYRLENFKRIKSRLI